MGKKVALSAMAVFLIWQSYKILGNISQFETNSYALLIFMAWIINLYITGIFAFSGFAFPTQHLLPGAYYRIRNPKRLRQVYKRMGVHTFRKMLLATLWRNKAQRERYFDGTSSGLSNLETQSMKSEFGHVIPFVILIFISVFLFLIGLPELGLFTMFINVLGNLYPVLLQRHHRMRIELIRTRK